MSLPTQPCIQPNPDIAGIGVRVSIYTQAILTVIPAFLFMLDGKITLYEFRTLSSMNTTLLLTACALLVSSFVQAGTYGLSVYHAIIVLNLSWINNISTVAYSLVDPSGPKGEVEDENEEDDGDHSCSAIFLSLYRSSPTRWNWPEILCTVHLCAVGAFGLWVWAKIDTFGNGGQSQCNPQTFITFFWHDILVTSRSFRKLSLALYSIMVIPVVNLMVFTIFLGIIPAGIILLVFTVIYNGLALMGLVSPTWLNKHTWWQKLQVAGLVIVATADILFLINTELMIRRSRFNVQAGESQWTLGQTLTMLLLGLPLLDLLKDLKRWYKQEHATDEAEGGAGAIKDEPSGKAGNDGQNDGHAKEQGGEADSSPAIVRLEQTKWPSNATLPVSQV